MRAPQPPGFQCSRLHTAPYWRVRWPSFASFHSPDGSTSGRHGRRRLKLNMIAGHGRCNLGSPPRSIPSTWLPSGLRQRSSVLTRTLPRRDRSQYVPSILFPLVQRRAPAYRHRHESAAGGSWACDLRTVSTSRGASSRPGAWSPASVASFRPCRCGMPGPGSATCSSPWRASRARRRYWIF